MSVSVSSLMIYVSTVQKASPAPPRLTPPPQIMTTSTAEPSASPLTVQHVYRAGRLTQAEEIMEENEDIETISQAVTLLSAPKFTILSASSDNWISESDGEALTIQIKATDNNWQKLIENLPMYDASGNKYYYWVEETAITGNSTLTAFDVAYKFDDGSDDTTYCIDAELHGNGEITIRNTPKESQAGELPSSGSTGTRIYYTLGAMLLLLAAAGYWAYSIKRRRWYDE